MLEKLFFFVVLLGVLVTVHELGHFLMAKLFKVQVFKFSIGFGPELLAFQLGETRYAISAVPLGGFVRMAGEEDLLERWGGPDAPAPDPKRLLTARPRWQRALIMVGGPLANLILPALIFSIAAYGDNEIAAPIVGTVLPETPAARAGLKSGDRIVRIEGQEIVAFDDISALVGPRAGKEVELEILRDKQRQKLRLRLRSQASLNALQQVEERGRVGVGAFRQLAVVSPLPGDSPAQRAGIKGLDKILAVDGEPVASWPELSQKLQRAEPGHKSLLRIERRRLIWDGVLRLELPEYFQSELSSQAEAVAEAPEKIPASATTLHMGQLAALPTLPRKFAGLDPAELETPELQERLNKTWQAAESVVNQGQRESLGLGFAGACVSSLIANSPAQQLGLQRGDCLLSVDGRQAFHWSLVDETLQTHPKAIHLAIASVGGKTKVLAFRLQARPEVVPIRRGQKRYIFGAEQSAVLIPGSTELLQRGFLAAIATGFNRTVELTAMTAAGIGLLLTGQLPFASVGGPMMLFDLAGQSAERGLSYFIFMLAFISINLGVLNLLPVPVLDGGHLLMLAIESVMRRPLPKRSAEIANLVGLSLLLLLMLAVMGNDLARYWRSILGLFG